MLTQLKWTSSDVLPHKSRGQIYEKSVYQHLTPRRSAVEGSETPDEGLRLCASSGVFPSPPNLQLLPEGKKSKLSVERRGANLPRLECGLGRGKKRSTVGRQKNLLWVGRPTYSGSQRRPTVDRFLGVPKRTIKPDRGGGEKSREHPVETLRRRSWSSSAGLLRDALQKIGRMFGGSELAELALLSASRLAAVLSRDRGLRGSLPARGRGHVLGQTNPLAPGP